MPQHDPDVTLPRTAADALKLWDAGERVPAFRVESEGASQNDIWAVAFDAVASRGADPVKTDLTTRELIVASELFIAMRGHGFAKMVQNNLHGAGEPIFVQRPLHAGDVSKPAAGDDGANPGRVS